MTGKKLTFDSEKHEYKLGDEEVPSVSRILQASGINQDYSNLNAYYAKRGNRIHNLIRWELQQGLDSSKVDPEIRGWLIRFKRFAGLAQLKPKLLEKALYCPVYGYAGTIDFFGEAFGHDWLLDWKRPGFDESHRVQLAGAYLPLLETWMRENGLGGVVAKVRVGVVSFIGDAPSPKIIPVETSGQREVFRAALLVTNWRRRYRGLKLRSEEEESEDAQG